MAPFNAGLLPIACGVIDLIQVRNKKFKVDSDIHAKHCTAYSTGILRT
ncbi:hypothetical protein APHWI1_0390 [Anaplasma phagocytophilum str. ApWI1]|uniref:Uncharacterized protein n=3 Tax=Anaplasma phagocytophilum TaxID=948 RepID=Q2GJJ4_ANAPZ|nr:hypothetical protein [Anaplasma phagocytophilum]ABD43906.1 hypothetical protein APH_0881 [Anaplasma phagocytophilum str. HZ]AGR79533.1 hypothetical protein YYU_04050 [Anaplasma phagocytophilum str. HZ2]AGR80785.1 hypothetical protein WSQ_04065 [Anaplasma phagocytophilum str. JM]AGR82037.1 hypothetical protein YYY_04055 [Anaplasma phagocytophilum str. Dog2]KJV63199.1 hypothetical protein EPHNCH_1209 [Anaplasma phagocytophilum str. NCH-1]KJV83367.1 hypothetical protein APHHGE2_1187 [Anaplasm